MLSYRHAFHAGNHADVLKHLVLTQLLDYLAKKDKGFLYIDTHAGAGLYALAGARAQHHAEHAQGVLRLVGRAGAPAAVKRYLEQVAPWLGKHNARFYPGSPHLALARLRAQDRAHFFELHGADHERLAANLRRDFPLGAGRVALSRADGFLGLPALLPPPTRRALTLIDPSYEDKRDYLRVLMAVKTALAKFRDGVFAVWYPCLPRGDASQLPAKLSRLAESRAGDWLEARLTVAAPTKRSAVAGEEEAPALYGSGVVVINPPWTLAADLREALPWVCAALAQDEAASWAVNVGVAKNAAPIQAALKKRENG